MSGDSLSRSGTACCNGATGKAQPYVICPISNGIRTSALSGMLGGVAM